MTFGLRALGPSRPFVPAHRPIDRRRLGAEMVELGALRDVGITSRARLAIEAASLDESLRQIAPLLQRLHGIERDFQPDPPADDDLV